MAEEQAVALLGNHELMFIKAMMGDEGAELAWSLSAGNAVLIEMQITKGMTMQTLQSIARWMRFKLRLYHIDEYGTFYVHAGLPIDKHGNLLLEYQGKQGLAALDQMQEDLRQATSVTEPVFAVLFSNHPLLWSVDWFTKLSSERAADNLLQQLGATRIVRTRS